MVIGFSLTTTNITGKQKKTASNRIETAKATAIVAIAMTMTTTNSNNLNNNNGGSSCKTAMATMANNSKQ